MRYPRLIRRPFWGADSIRCFRKGWELHPRGMDGLKLNGGIDVLLPPPSLSDNKRAFSVKFFCPIFDNFEEAWGDGLLIDFRYFFCFFFLFFLAFLLDYTVFLDRRFNSYFLRGPRLFFYDRVFLPTLTGWVFLLVFFPFFLSSRPSSRRFYSSTIPPGQVYVWRREGWRGRRRRWEEVSCCVSLMESLIGCVGSREKRLMEGWM